MREMGFLNWNWLEKNFFQSIFVPGAVQNIFSSNPSWKQAGQLIEIQLFSDNVIYLCQGP